MTIHNALPRARAAAAVAGAALALAAVLPATPASAIGGGFGNPTSSTLVNVHSGKCLEIADWRTDVGAPARQWDCTWGGNQHRNYVGTLGDRGELGIANLNSALLLEIANWRTDNGAPARQWPGSWVGVAQANQAWITAIKRY
ncbi:RICIN domain-containing protein [Kitasatospora sp. GAS204B]|uniref:RICIN domain-containing protein n=1 Tax=unclassified Kitasatospora TaxID=2633591 RepID=UPI002475B44F|nr:RICIN domain-containing protein [Kitasatospora sp. GAS204B]MDH6123023.1 hypothetical protein [Kitasatospora sp. GAS204B]